MATRCEHSDFAEDVEVVDVFDEMHRHDVVFEPDEEESEQESDPEPLQKQQKRARRGEEQVAAAAQAPAARGKTKSRAKGARAAPTQSKSSEGVNAAQWGRKVTKQEVPPFEQEGDPKPGF